MIVLGCVKILLYFDFDFKFLIHKSIGFAIAEGLAENGAKVVISSRKQENVEDAVRKLKEKNLEVSGCVCHVGSDSDRTSLLQKVGFIDQDTFEYD